MELKRNQIGGIWVEGDDAAENRNPSNLADVVGLYTRAAVGRGAEAAAAARAALPAWAGASPQVRADLLETVGADLCARKDEIGRIFAREEGKTLPEAVAETARATHIFRFFPARQSGWRAMPWPRCAPTSTSRSCVGLSGWSGW